MSEAADELDRMAEEFDGKSADYRLRSAGDQKTWGMILDGAIASVHKETAKRLRDRAAELRQASQPMAGDRPNVVARGQWWSCAHASPGRVYDLAVEDDGELVAYFRGVNGERWAKETRVVTSSKSWTYLGDADQPAQNA